MESLGMINLGNVSAWIIFVQGGLSFLSPCILPLLPVYLGYISRDEKLKGRRVINNIFFVIGISIGLLLLGITFAQLGQVIGGHRDILSWISGIVMIAFGFVQFGVLERLGIKITILDREKKFHLNGKNRKINCLLALALGFVMTFGWTPCFGPIMASVLLMVANTGTFVIGMFYIGIYILGFILPFVIVGLFTDKILDVFRKKEGLSKFVVRAGAILMIVMGAITISGALTGDNSQLKTDIKKNSQISQSNESTKESMGIAGSDNLEEGANEGDRAYDFILTDLVGKEHRLADYKGKTVFLNFWATWCPPCREEMPDIEKLYEKWGENADNLVIMTVASPNIGREQDEGYIKNFVTEKGYKFPVLLDKDGTLTRRMGIVAYPTTFMIDRNGKIFARMSGALTEEMMDMVVGNAMHSG